MAHAHDVKTEHVGQRLGIIEAYNQSTGQARPLGDRDPGERVPRHARFPERGKDDPLNHLNMGTRSQLRDDAAETLMDSMLGGDNVGQNQPIRSQDGGRGLITGGFNTENGTLW